MAATGAPTSLAGLLVLLMLVPSVASAAPVVVDRAPYTGAVGGIWTLLYSSGGCTFSNFSVGPTISTTSGDVDIASRSGASCRSVVGQTADAFAAFYGPNFTVNATGTYTIEYRWNLSWSVLVRLQGYASAVVGLVAFGNLIDTATNKAVQVGDTTIVLAACGASYPACGHNWSSSGSKPHAQLKLSLNLTGGHRYEFYSGLSSTVYVHDGFLRCIFNHCAPFYGHGVVTVDAGSHGRGGRLLSMRAI